MFFRLNNVRHILMSKNISNNTYLLYGIANPKLKYKGPIKHTLTTCYDNKLKYIY